MMRQKSQREKRNNRRREKNNFLESIIGVVAEGSDFFFYGVVAL